MTDKATRKDLKARYRERPPKVGVYWIVNGKAGRILPSSSTNLPSVGNKLAFAKSTNLPGALDQQIRRDVAVFCHSDEGSAAMESLDEGKQRAA